MSNTNENQADSPQNAAKMPNLKGKGNHTIKLEKAVLRAFVPWLGTTDSNDMALIDASQYLLSGARSQLELFQSVTNEIPEREEIQIRAGSIVGFSEGLINQINALEAITEALCSQIYDLIKERDSALKILKTGGEV